MLSRLTSQLTEFSLDVFTDADALEIVEELKHNKEITSLTINIRGFITQQSIRSIYNLVISNNNISTFNLDYILSIELVALHSLIQVLLVQRKKIREDNVSKYRNDQYVLTRFNNAKYVNTLPPEIAKDITTYLLPKERGDLGIAVGSRINDPDYSKLSSTLQYIQDIKKRDKASNTIDQLGFMYNKALAISGVSVLNTLFGPAIFPTLIPIATLEICEFLLQSNYKKTKCDYISAIFSVFKLSYTALYYLAYTSFDIRQPIIILGHIQLICMPLYKKSDIRDEITLFSPLRSWQLPRYLMILYNSISILYCSLLTPREIIIETIYSGIPLRNLESAVYDPAIRGLVLLSLLTSYLAIEYISTPDKKDKYDLFKISTSLQFSYFISLSTSAFLSLDIALGVEYSNNTKIFCSAVIGSVILYSTCHTNEPLEL
ncbi:MAG: hypothetical protein ACK5WS_05835 [Alphaproteobacteria bacterium]|jgi:hypothetical protein